MKAWIVYFLFGKVNLILIFLCSIRMQNNIIKVFLYNLNKYYEKCKQRYGLEDGKNTTNIK